jgi:hypothetical protein
MAGAASGVLHALLARLSIVSLGQVMLASLVLVLVAFFFRSASPALARWVVIGGLILFLTAFALSLLSGHSRHEGAGAARSSTCRPGLTTVSQRLSVGRGR